MGGQGSWTMARWRARREGGLEWGEGEGEGGDGRGVCVWGTHQRLPPVPVQRERRVRLRVRPNLPLWLKEGTFDAGPRCLDDLRERLQPYPLGAAVLWVRGCKHLCQKAAGLCIRGWAWAPGQTRCHIWGCRARAGLAIPCTRRTHWWERLENRRWRRRRSRQVGVGVGLRGGGGGGMSRVEQCWAWGGVEWAGGERVSESEG